MTSTPGAKAPTYTPEQMETMLRHNAAELAQLARVASQRDATLKNERERWEQSSAIAKLIRMNKEAAEAKKAAEAQTRELLEQYAAATNATGTVLDGLFQIQQRQDVSVSDEAAVINWIVANAPFIAAQVLKVDGSALKSLIVNNPILKSMPAEIKTKPTTAIQWKQLEALNPEPTTVLFNGHRISRIDVVQLSGVGSGYSTSVFMPENLEAVTGTWANKLDVPAQLGVTVTLDDERNFSLSLMLEPKGKITLEEFLKEAQALFHLSAIDGHPITSVEIVQIEGDEVTAGRGACTTSFSGAALIVNEWVKAMKPTDPSYKLMLYISLLNGHIVRMKDYLRPNSAYTAQGFYEGAKATYALEMQIASRAEEDLGF